MLAINKKTLQLMLQGFLVARRGIEPLFLE